MIGSVPIRLPTLGDLFLGSSEVMAGGNLSDHDQQPVVCVQERSSGSPLSVEPSSLLRRSSWDFHGNSAAGGRWALFHLHDNCIQSKHYDGAGWGGRGDGRGSV